jgi:hypothetical protein
MDRGRRRCPYWGSSRARSATSPHATTRPTPASLPPSTSPQSFSHYDECLQALERPPSDQIEPVELDKYSRYGLYGQTQIIRISTCSSFATATLSLKDGHCVPSCATDWRTIAASVFTENEGAARKHQRLESQNQGMNEPEGVHGGWSRRGDAAWHRHRRAEAPARLEGQRQWPVALSADIIFEANPSRRADSYNFARVGFSVSS